MTVGYARLRGSMGATFCPLAALRSAIEFLFWAETAVLGQILAGRSWEVTVGYGRLRTVTERETEEQKKGRRKPKKMTEMSSVECGVWSGKCSVECRV